MMNSESLSEIIMDARQRTLDLVADLTDEEMRGPQLRIVNPPLWEIGHVGWFQEYWVLRNVRKLSPLREDVDSLYDSMKVGHDTRWDLALPSRPETVEYLCRVRDRGIDGLQTLLEGDARYSNSLSVFHGEGHSE